MADLNLKLPTGRVVGRFITEVQDNDDPDMDPQLVPAVGRVTIKSSIDYLKVDDPIAGVFTTFRGPHIAVLDTHGYLSTPRPDSNTPMYSGMTLWANDSENISVKGWTYTAIFELKTRSGKSLELPPVTFELGTNEVVDLSEVVKVPSTPGYGLPQAEAAAIRAANSAEKSEELLVAATQIAQSVREDADAGLFKGDPGRDGAPGNATMRVDTTVGTRVFISDGTTERMVAGSTGWRSLPYSWGSSSFGGARLIREENTVRMLFVSYVKGESPSQPILTLPAGFRPSATIYNQGIKDRDNIAATNSIDILVAGVVSGYGTLTSGRLQVNLSWSTNDPWPTTLPGTPV